MRPILVIFTLLLAPGAIVRSQTAPIPSAFGAWATDDKTILFDEGYETPASIVELCEGEDLKVANLVVADSDGNRFFDSEFFLCRLESRSKPHTLVGWNQEFRSTFRGHMTLFHLCGVVEPV